MNITLPASILLVLLLPGLLCVLGYNNGQLTKDADEPISVASVSGRTLLAIIAAILLQLLATSVAHLLTPYEVDLESLLFLLGGYYRDTAQFEKAIGAVSNFPAAVTGYHLGLLVVAPIFGFAVGKWVRDKRLDRKFGFLRVNNHYFYLFNGRILEFPEVPGDIKDLEGVLVSAIVNHSGTAHLYVGVLSHYWFDKRNELESIALYRCYRRRLDDDRGNGGVQPAQIERAEDETAFDSRFYWIDGDYLVLRATEIVTLNVKYITHDALRAYAS